MTVVDGLSDMQLRLIYEAKCQDLEIQVMPLQERRFFEYCCKYLKDRDFNFTESGIGFAAGRAIAECMCNNEYFCKLGLAKNGLGDAGAITVTKILARALNLVHLDLSSNSLSPEGLSEVLKILSVHESLVSLDISSHEGLHRNRLGTLGSRAVSQLLSKNHLVVMLNISGTSVGQDGVEILSSGLSANRSVLHLGLANNSLSGKSMERFMHAVSHSSITHLDLSSNNLGNCAADAIAYVLAGSERNDCKLKVLDLSETRLGYAASDKIFAAMTRNSSLESLLMPRNPIGSLPNPALAHLISDNLTLRTLDLTGCGLRSNGAAAIGEGLAKNHSLKVLLIGSNAFEVMTPQEEQIEAFASGLSRNSALTVLDLSNNRITDRGGVVLCNVLRSHATISQIILRDNELREQTGQMLADMTRTRRRLVKISVENNPFSHKYVLEIRTNTATNLKSQGLSRTPGLLRELRELELQDTNVDAIVGEMQRLQAEESALLQQIELHKEKYAKYQVAEEAKTQVVLKEAEAVQKRTSQVADEFGAVNNTIKVRCRQQEDYAYHAELKTLEEKINSAHLELVRKEKERTRHPGNSLRAYSASCRSHFVERIDRLSEELRTQKQAKKQLETTLLGLRKQVEVLKFDIEQMAAERAEDEAVEEGKERKTVKGRTHAAPRKKKKKKKKEEVKEPQE